ncbi:unnamed protein product [Phytophthora fragariaefolia]|uniref:Unnamed protein product n=1 Tax=Phytophthora fragariaefolia TaxID=1490495 RepID=A0A9W7D107_9STRA|nr:unnamed protein product [Phytophthora fragariaefolia]
MTQPAAIRHQGPWQGTKVPRNLDWLYGMRIADLQYQSTLDVLAKVGLDQCKAPPTPMDIDHRFFEENGEPFQDTTLYREVGSPDQRHDYFVVVGKQPTMALSTVEAKYVAACAAVQDCIAIHQLLQQLGLMQQNDAILLRLDNQSAIKSMENAITTQRTRHLQIKTHFILDAIATKQVQV